MKLSIRDRAFAHSPFSNNPATPVSFSKYMTWDRDAPASAKTIYTDAEIVNAPDGAIAWLLEPIHGRPDAYEFLLKRAPFLREIWTCDRALLEAIPNGRFVPFGGCWIAPEDRKVWQKLKDTSIIVSRKRGCEAYDLRHAVATELKDWLDVYGIEYTPLELKIDGLRDYRFQVVIENVQCDYCFTEKLIGCFATGTVPIYRGCPSIGNFFNMDGIVTVTDLDSIDTAINEGTPKAYRDRLPAIQENFVRAKEFYLAEDWLVEHHRELMEELSL